MSKLKARVEEILDGINDPATLAAVRKVQAILSAPADTEAIDRLTEKVSFLESVTQAQSARIVVLEKSQSGPTTPAVDPERIDKLEQRFNALQTALAFKEPAIDPERFEKLETLFDDQRVKLWARIDHIDRYFTNRLYEVEQIAGSTSYDHSTTEYMQKELTERVERLERAAVFATEDPRPPQRDTSWRPHDASKLDYSPGYYPNWDETVVVMTRGSDEIQRPAQAVDWDWSECGDTTIIAWRYAKEGE